MWADNASTIDMLGYKPYAELIYEISNNDRMSPLTIGLFGNWGSGKSTLLGLIEEKINQNDCNDSGIISISLNAWMFEGYDDAKTAIMGSLLKAIESNKSITIKEGFADLLKRVNWFRVAGTIAKNGIPLAMTLASGVPIVPNGSMETIKDVLGSKDKIQELGDKLKDFRDEHINESISENIIENVRVFRNEFEKQLEKANIKNLIVMIDDLDRCTPERILETLEAVKLFLAVKRTTFIVAIDERLVTYAIKKKYPRITNEDGLDVSNDYIEKIIQLPIRLPELSEIDIKNYMLFLICEMFLKVEAATDLMGDIFKNDLMLKGGVINSSDIVSKVISAEEDRLCKFRNSGSIEEFKNYLIIFENIAEVVSTSLRGNPRQAKRFLNTFYMRKRMAEIQGFAPNLAILAKLMVLEEINKDLFNEVYVWQAGNNGKADELKEIYDLIYNESDLTKYSKWDSDKMKNWLTVEPINIYDEDLSRYFYLSREAISEVSFVKNKLSFDEKKILNDISEATDATVRRKLIEKLKKVESVSQEKIINGLIGKFKQSHEFFEVMCNIYQNFDIYKDSIIKEFKNLTKDDMTGSNINLLGTLYNIDESRINDLIAELKDQGIFMSNHENVFNRMKKSKKK